MQTTPKNAHLNDQKTKETNKLDKDELDSLLSISSGKNVKEAIKQEKRRIELLKLKINSIKRLRQLQKSRRIVAELKTMVETSVHLKNHLHLTNEDLKDKFLLCEEIEEHKTLSLHRHEKDLASLVSIMDPDAVRDAFMGKPSSPKQSNSSGFFNYFKFYSLTLIDSSWFEI